MTKQQREEISCGAVIYRIIPTGLEYLILRHLAGHWAFSKGHTEGNETNVQTALREIFEETGLRVRLDSSWHMTTRYRPAPDIMKTVIYFLAQAEASTEICCQITEIIEARWCDYSSAIQLLTYENDRHILTKAHSILKQHEQNRI